MAITINGTTIDSLRQARDNPDIEQGSQRVQSALDSGAISVFSPETDGFDDVAASAPVEQTTQYEDPTDAKSQDSNRQMPDPDGTSDLEKKIRQSEISQSNRRGLLSLLGSGNISLAREKANELINSASGGTADGSPSDDAPDGPDSSRNAGERQRRAGPGYVAINPAGSRQSGITTTGASSSSSDGLLSSLGGSTGLLVAVAAVVVAVVVS